MLSVVSNHSRFSSQWVTDECAKFKTKFDLYDNQNDKAAQVFLLDSVSKDLKEHLKLKMSPSDPFVVVRRAELKSYRRATKPRRRFIRVHHKAPTLHEQALFRRLDIMHFNVLRFLEEFRTDFYSSGRSPRGERPSEGDNHCVHDLGPKPKSKGRHKTHRERHSRNTHHVQSPSVSPPASPRSSQ